MKRLLDIVLVAIFILCPALLFLAHEDPFVRKAVYAYTGFRPIVPNAKAIYKIIYDLAAAAWITLAFYALVVRLPDRQRRKRLKGSLERHYKAFREDCIQIMLVVADGSYSADLPEALIEKDKFRDYFKKKVTSDRDRWDEFLIKLNEKYLRELLTCMEIFRDEVAFTLNNTDIPKDKPFEFLKRLSAAIYSMKDATLADELKPLASFLWSMFAWDPSIGKEDIVKKMIADI